MIEQRNYQLQFKEITEQLICPLTQQIMIDPVTIETGHSFDQYFLKAWFERGHVTNPITGLPLKSTKYFPNLCIKNIINKIPKLKQRMTQQKKNIEKLLITLQQIWNSQTPNGLQRYKQQTQKLKAQNQQLKVVLQNQSHQKLIKKLQFEVQIAHLKQKMETLERTNKYINSMLKEQVKTRKILQKQNQNLMRKIPMNIVLKQVEQKQENQQQKILQNQQNRNSSNFSSYFSQQIKNNSLYDRAIPKIKKQQKDNNKKSVSLSKIQNNRDNYEQIEPKNSRKANMIKVINFPQVSNNKSIKQSRKQVRKK